MIARLINKIVEFFRSRFLGISTEDLWYENFFSKNPYWSTREPNPAESERWMHIQNLLAFSGRNSFESIIDFGCGRGWLSSLLAQFGPVVGIEPVKAVVKHGKKLYPHLRLVHGSLDQINSRSADLIVCSEVIEHIPDLQKRTYLKSFFDCLQPSGFLLLTTPRAEAWDEWKKYTDPSQPREDWIDELSLISMCLEAGFELVKSSRYSETPGGGPAIEVYQLHLFTKADRLR